METVRLLAGSAGGRVVCRDRRMAPVADPRQVGELGRFRSGPGRVRARRIRLESGPSAGTDQVASLIETSGMSFFKDSWTAFRLSMVVKMVMPISLAFLISGPLGFWPFV